MTLKPRFDVSWMTDPVYLAQVGHALGALSIMLLVTLLSVLHGWGWAPILGTLGVGVLLAGVKEFWFDLKYETDPVQTVKDSAIDFAFYMVGALVGLGVATYAELTIHAKLIG